MIARIENGAVVEFRSMSIDDVPEHKRHLWRPIEGDAPVHDFRVEVVIGPELVIEPNRVVRQWTVQRRPDAEIAVLVKLEARRRILERFPEWKQTNMTARGVELQDVWRRVGSWTINEQAEADALAAAWDWIKAVRAASDAIETMQPIPADYADNARWPA